MHIKSIKRIIDDNSIVIKSIVNSCLEDINDAIDLMIEGVVNDKKILWCGNGGSAADAQHMAAELMGGLVSHDRKPIASIALTTDTSFITAWSNDTDYNSIFSRQVEGLGRNGDILIAISTSGNSENVLNAIHSATSNNMKVIILTGNNGGRMRKLGNVRICIPSDNTQRIQEGHLLVEHILCELIEDFVLQK